MLKVFNPSPVQVGSIECLQSAQNWQRKSLSLQGLNLLQSVLIKLTTGKISITTSSGEYITASGPMLIFLAKDQTINITMEETHEQLNYNLIELDSASIKNAYNFFLYEHADFSAPLTKPTTKHLLAPIETGVARVFNLLHSSNKSQKLSQDKKEYLIRFLLSEFIYEPEAFALFRELSQNTLAENIYNIIISDISRKWALKDISDSLYMSCSTLKRKLKQEHTSFSEVYLNARMNKATKLLRNSEYNITRVAYMCGYDSASYFTCVFKKHFKTTPSEFLAFLSSSRHQYVN
ncbi:AraC family transcriptional regulator [Salmonella enterica subsp. enterica]|uniref:AraC family transcriptional regulator n=1 Tax=Salmonella typhimurium TaxID=90371 RepID=A0A706ZP10_SALTM|nr:AraC family transcriptional regulator [Salmonella enterica subsp. enterica serovar Typhimurium]ECB2996796.1 AraC family transcriptional regulator [Salmonella enterica subsp. enterica serovar Typhimurium]ECB6662105.1 AraC family transcriptional regulator [Salmonella enterica subsp. enterica serovar Typhimurium]ECC2157972.1 AraC family transcriptional regulator [Salmonella enterica subsp. enterica serovar Typhimurium]ECJ0905196.1 AraC family transcriptional regulator [Salmonella enterica subsp